MASRGRPRPLVTIDNLDPPPGISQVFTPVQDENSQTKRWYHYLPLYGTIILIFAPHPSLLYFLVHHYLITLNQPIRFTIHLLVTYTLTFLMCTSLIVLIARDPGPVTFDEPGQSRDDEGSEEVGLTEALNSPDDFFCSGKMVSGLLEPITAPFVDDVSLRWRVPLRLDSIGNSVPLELAWGHRTYPAFLHFLLCITLLASYIAVIAAYSLYYAFTHPYTIDEVTPVHELLLGFAGIVFTLVIVLFCTFIGVALASFTDSPPRPNCSNRTNQTTIENISPFLLLRHLPVLPSPNPSPSHDQGYHHRLSDPPLEHELSYPQRRLVKDAHGQIRLYDIGWRKNWEQVFGFGWDGYGYREEREESRRRKRWLWWLCRILYGGSSNGDGKSFPKNVRSDELLARLARELVNVDNK
ncbi:hypothetical protein D9758_011592 [Tetrapyrgos nigripes]|uniref:Uncharacterized protein n=1 Tax=Tetrapyrgos nigripes TaxID=182062 RepID=A0A8H5FQ06_9AGAR|nr:hypothetical protein D9758_011592 [Tetrapyrgos nigripes]